MKKIIACLDTSLYTNSVCDLSAWVSENTDFDISLLHVAEPHSEIVAKADLSCSIGLGAKSELLEELTKADEMHGKSEQKEGWRILENANDNLKKQGCKNIEILHLRGEFTDILTELKDKAEIIVIGKSGEENTASNIGNLTRNIDKPLLIATKNLKPIERFLIAYDGSKSVEKAVEYITGNPLLKNLECHLVKICEQSGKAEEILKQAEDKLLKAGFKVKASLQQGKPIAKIVAGYINENNINLLVMGAHNHSQIHDLILGSNTKALIRDVDVPILLFGG